MRLTIMGSPTIVEPLSQPFPTSRRATVLEHRRQNILTMKYRSSSVDLRETAAQQQSEPTKRANGAKKRRKGTKTTQQKLSCASYRLQSAVIDSWLKESMPLPPEDLEPLPITGLGIAMFERQHFLPQSVSHMPVIAPLNIGRSGVEDIQQQHHHQSEPTAHKMARTLADVVSELRLTDYEEQQYQDYREGDTASCCSSSSSEILNWPLVST